MSTLIGKLVQVNNRYQKRKVTQADIRRAQIELLRWAIAQETGLTTVGVQS